MGSQSSGLKFAAIGHLDCWTKIVKFVNKLRSEENNTALSEEKIKEVYSFIPPGKLFHVQVNSPLSGTMEGFYIETFISPDELGPAHLWQNVQKVRAACEKAAMLGADVVSLGGFTSIILETGAESISRLDQTAFTTGNTLTAAFIADAVEKAAKKWHICLKDSTLLIIGSTGDIGSACVSYFSDHVKQILLTARQPGPLKKQESELKRNGIRCSSAIAVSNFLPQADIVICVASSLLPDTFLNLLPPHAIICDAGYPKNLRAAGEKTEQKVFAGGMGMVKNGYQFAPDDYKDVLYEFPVSNISHGCLLEATVLAMERKAVPYSKGRGNISKKSMSEMLQMAARHEIVTAPFFGTKGLVN